MEEISTTGKEQPHAPDIENTVLQEEASPSASRKQKWISVWQIILLLMLFGLAIKDMTDSSNFFTAVFLLTLWGVLRKRKVLPERVKVIVESWWHPCEVRLRALHIKLMQGRKTPPAVDKTCTCLNCGTTYVGNYCYRCGQSRNVVRYRFKSVIKNIVVSFFKINNEFGRTVTELLYRPGYMIRDFISGKRVKYCPPFQSLFILAALYIMAVQIVDPAALRNNENAEQTDKEEIIAAKKEIVREMEKVYGKEDKTSIPIVMDQLDKSLNKSDEKKDSVGATRKLMKEDEGDIILNVSEASDKIERLFSKSTFLRNVWDTLKSWGHGNKALSIMVTLPLFAFATQLAFRRRRHKLNCTATEHVVIQTYIACQMLLMSIIVLPFNGHAMVNKLYELPLWFIFALFCWDYKQLYRCTWWRSFWRTLLMCVYCLVMVILLACLATAVVLWGSYVLNSIL